MKEKTRGVKRRKYNASFKEEVLGTVSAGRPASEVAQSLGIGENLIYKWESRSSGKEQQPATIPPMLVFFTPGVGKKSEVMSL